MSQTIEELAKAVNISHVSTKSVIKQLYTDILVSLYRKNPSVERPEMPDRPVKPEEFIDPRDEKKYEKALEIFSNELKEYEAKVKQAKKDVSIEVPEKPTPPELPEAVVDKDEHAIYMEELREYRQQMKLYTTQLKEAELTEEFNIHLNQKIAEVYKSRHGKKFDYNIHAKNKKIPSFLMGPPGQGKTAAFFAAAAEACADLDLNLVPHVSDDYVPKLNDYVMIVQECAGENSSITFGGIPRAEEIFVGGKKIHVLKKALNYRFTVPGRCAGGTVLFDDAANAATVIQNVLLPVAQNGTFQGMELKNVLVGFTGNLGALDGTYVNEQSSALLSRVYSMFVTDTLTDFLARSYAYYNDEAGTYGFLNYLERKGDEGFSVVPEPGNKHAHACSRTHDNFIQKVRGIVESHGGRGVGEENALPQISELAMSMYGPAQGYEISAYYQSYIQGADPLARKYVQEGKLDAAEFKLKYSGGASDKDMAFGYQFADACGDYAVRLLTTAEDPIKALPEAMKRFGNAVLLLGDSEFSYALTHLKMVMAANISDFAQITKEGRELTNEIREKIAHIINDLPDCGESKRAQIIQVITDFDKIEGDSIFEEEKKGPRKEMKAKAN